MFLVFSIGSAISVNTPMLIAFRFFNGVSVTSVTLNPSIIGDLFVIEEQGTGQAMMGFAPLIGPIFGPAISAYISESIRWRWMFWILAIASGVIEFGFIAFVRETYKVTILRRKTKRLCKETNNNSLTPETDRPQGRKDIIRLTIIRPARMLIKSPVILILAFYVSVIFAYIYILLTTMTSVFEINYGFSTGSVGLVYIGLEVGMTVGMFLCRFTLDKYVRRMNNREEMKPEQRLLPMVIGGLVIPVGLVWYGWTVEKQVHWLAPVVGLAFCGFSLAATLIPSYSYIFHAFGIHSASAIAAIITLRCLFGVIVPLAGPALFGRLGLGWGNTLLAFIALDFLSLPVGLLSFGERLRIRSNLEVVY